ncbi:hypothetical protein [uncultured Vibrio sp.]|uniref:hypothetical protein n=1 Tax=uncultured Vibrio sp. TaxID=114054 RepID=UPI002AA7AB79|nr:hypothetical protein [uncultured Vibrio sp.]
MAYFTIGTTACYRVDLGIITSPVIKKFKGFLCAHPYNREEGKELYETVVSGELVTSTCLSQNSCFPTGGWLAATKTNLIRIFYTKNSVGKL